MGRWRCEQVDEEEVAAGLGPGWPSAGVLANLQQHCIALSYEACQHSCEGARHSISSKRAVPCTSPLIVRDLPVEAHLGHS